MDLQASSAPETRTYSTQLHGWYRLFRGSVLFLLHILSRLDVERLDLVPEQGPYLLITNHLHWLDPPVLMAVIPYQIIVFAAEKWKKHLLLGPIFRTMDAIFVNRGEVDRVALRKALAC
jgi:1-acyl-sn-glycerol-3-phosphate acyltransferase